MHELHSQVKRNQQDSLLGLPLKNTMNPLSQKTNVTQDVSCLGILTSLDFTDFKNIHTFLNEQMKDYKHRMCGLVIL